MNIFYTIQIHNYWHCGSGLSAGADVDQLVIKDKEGFPFVPGKTMKGLVREAVKDLIDFSQNTESDIISQLFGEESDKLLEPNDGCLFFKNATLAKKEKEIIRDSHTQQYLFESISSTAIAEDGVADNHSLRRIEVTVPCKLNGEILYVPENRKKIIKQALQYIKRLGQNRNRGLGRCDITLNEEGGEK